MLLFGGYRDKDLIRYCKLTWHDNWLRYSNEFFQRTRKLKKKVFLSRFYLRNNRTTFYNSKLAYFNRLFKIMITSFNYAFNHSFTLVEYGHFSFLSPTTLHDASQMIARLA